MCVRDILVLGVWCVVCVFESLLIRDCFQGAVLQENTGLRWLGRCKGSLRYRASISEVREGFFVVWSSVCGLCVLVFADWGIVFRLRDWK